MSRIHCLGIMVTDALSGPLPQYPVAKERVQVVTRDLRFMPGGGAVNAASALARMGLAASIFSKAGDDPLGAFLLAELARVGVDTGGVRLSASDRTPFTYVGIHPDGDRTFIHTPGANLSFRMADLDRDRLLDAEYLLYPDLWVLPELDGRPVADLFREARRRGVVTLMDECWGLGPRRDTFEPVLPHCDYVLPSLDDMRAIYPGATAEQVAAGLLAQGAGTVVVKMGAEGCLVARPGSVVRVPAMTARVVDTTGAGDCWNAGFIAGLAHRADVVEAAGIGSACAAFCIEAVGGSAGVPDYKAVARRSARGSGRG
jgi:sugar/nucleoside kinase (ribokinase family)